MNEKVEKVLGGIIGVIFFAIIFITLLILITKATNSVFSKPVRENTKIVVVNSFTDTVDVYLTLGSPNKKWVNNVNGIFGIKTSGLQGSFKLAPGDSVYYLSKKSIQGNVCFLSAPEQCINDSTSGTTIIEFCLNNMDKKIPKAQETVEISCVSGISYIASVQFSGGGIWTANHPDYDTITFIQNGLMNENSSKPGVYPYGCDNCTYQSSMAPICTINKNEKPQQYSICNIQRNAREYGGTVRIIFNNPVTLKTK